ncbi:MAG: glycosyltransferase [Verrucomicrobiota bacterium]
MAEKNNEKPLVSVVTPNYNYAHYIGATIESLLNQDYPHIEHVIVDDGSTDNSVEVIQAYVDQHPGRVKLVTQENQGQTPAINEALNHVTGTLIGWINSDDTYCDNTVISSVVDAFVKTPGTDVVFGDYALIDKDDNLIAKVKELDMDLQVGACMGFANIIKSNCIVWTADRMETSGRLNNDFKYNMDGEFFSRLIPGAEVKHIPVHIANWRWHDACRTWQVRDVPPKIVAEWNRERQQTYHLLPFSKIVPFTWCGPFRTIYRARRVFQRLIKGHYKDRWKLRRKFDY